MEQTAVFDIAIVGGGLNGPALALAAAQAGFSVALIDPAADTSTRANFDGRSYALSHASYRLLARISIWDELSDLAQPMNEIKVSDAKNDSRPSPFMLHFDSNEIHQSPMGFMVEDRHLRAAYAAAFRKHPEITSIKGVVTEQDVQTGLAHLSIETDAGALSVSARLIVGCDGRKSGTAERAGISRTGWAYGQTGLVCTLEHDQPHHGIAHQMFLPSGPLAILPLTENRCSIVWSETTERASALSKADDDTFLEALRPVFGAFLGDIRLIGPRFAYPLGLTVAHDFARPRVALVGDAAHGMHPIAGQGLNAGLRDIAALVDVLKDSARIGGDIGSMVALEAYQSWRRPEVMRLVAATDILNRGFSNDNGLLRGIRDLGMGAVNAMPGIKRQFIREAAGLSGRLPDLMS